jgi:hypothetical protein
MTIKFLTKVCSVVGVALLAIASLVPADWILLLRTGHWEIEHFLAFFAVTSIVCLTWPRPFVVGGAPHGCRAAAGGPARFDARSHTQSYGGSLGRSRGAGGGSAC